MHTWAVEQLSFKLQDKGKKLRSITQQTGITGSTMDRTRIDINDNSTFVDLAGKQPPEKRVQISQLPSL